MLTLTAPSSAEMMLISRIGTASENNFPFSTDWFAVDDLYDGLRQSGKFVFSVLQPEKMRLHAEIIALRNRLKIRVDTALRQKLNGLYKALYTR